MSQVRKLLNGSIIKAETGTKTNENLYNVVVDGQTYTLNDDQLTQINNEVAALDPRHRMYLGGVSDTIKSGNMQGNRAKNSISFEALSNLSQKDLDFLKAGKHNYWEAVTDSDTYRAKEAINHALDIISRVANNKKSNSKNKLNSDFIELDYNTDSEGKRYLGPANYKAKDRVTQVLKHLQNGDASEYDAGDWDFTNVKGWINSLEGDDKYAAAAAYFNNLWNKMGKAGFDKEKDWNGQDIDDLLNMFRIGSKNGSTSAVSGDSGKSDTQKQLEADFANNPGLYGIIGENFEKGADGVWRLKENGQFNPGIQLLPGQGIWFNDDFYNSPYGVDQRLAPLKGLTFYNGALYKLDSPILSSILNAEGGFNAMKKSGNWSGADNIIRTRFTESASENPSFLGNDQYSEFLANPTYRFSDLTGLYNVQGMGNDDQIIQYVDLATPEEIAGNPYRQYKYKYALLDNRGKYLRDLAPEDLIEIAGGTTREGGLNTYRQIYDPSNKLYHNRYYEDILDNNQEASGFRFYYSKSDPNDIILHMPKINAQDVSDKDIRLPKEIAQILMQNKTWLNKVVGNAQNKANFVDWISSLVQSWWTNSNHGFWGWHSGDSRKLRNMGFTEQEIEQLSSALKKARTDGNRHDRRGRYLVNSPRIERLGGILKHQLGGKAGGAKNATGVTEKLLDVKNTNPQNAAGITEIGGDNWTNADTLDLIALAGDLGSLAAAFVPGANVASAGIGAASSTARYNANKQRGTKGAGFNYGIDLAMDAATLLPLLGAGAKGAKVVKAVKNALPLIVKAASVYGLGAAVVNSAEKIANGEKWTPRDLSMIANALAAGVGLSRQGGFGKGTKKVKVNEPLTIEGKNGSPNLTLSSKELENVNTPEKLFDKFFAKAKATNENLTKEAFSENYDVNELLKITKRWKPGWNPKTWFKLTENKSFTPTTTKEVQAIKSNGNSFRDWWYGIGFKQKQYNRQLRGLSPKQYVGQQQRIVVPENNTPGIMDLSVPAVVRQQKVYANVARPRGIALPQWINPFTRANRQGYVDQQPSGLVYQPEYKSGGKIVKGLTGIPGLTFGNNDFANNFNYMADYLSGDNSTMNPIVANALRDKRAAEVEQALSEGVKNPADKMNITEVEDGKKRFIGTRASEQAGGYNDNLPDQTKYLNSLVSAGRYLTTAKAQEDYRDTDLQRIEAGRYKYLPNHYSAPDTNNPIFARERAEISRQRASSFPSRLSVTSDPIYNNALWQQNNARLDALERDVLGRESDYAWNAKNATREVFDKNYNSGIATTNQNSQIDAAINSALFNPRLAYIQQKDASRAGASLEFQNNLMKDRQILHDFKQNQYMTDLQRKYDSDIKSEYSDAAKLWSGMNNADRSKYLDFEDYVSRTVNGAPDWIANRRKQDMAKALNWQKENSLIYNYGALAGKDSSVGVDRRSLGKNVLGFFGFKKGGRLNGTTRYTKEPDEQIWIDNNKAAHNAVNELNKSTIKLLLRALK